MGLFKKCNATLILHSLAARVFTQGVILNPQIRISVRPKSGFLLIFESVMHSQKISMIQQGDGGVTESTMGCHVTGHRSV